MELIGILPSSDIEKMPFSQMCGIKISLNNWLISKLCAGDQPGSVNR